jgi:hypothetical protein
VQQRAAATGQIQPRADRNRGARHDRLASCTRAWVCGVRACRPCSGSRWDREKTMLAAVSEYEPRRTARYPDPVRRSFVSPRSGWGRTLMCATDRRHHTTGEGLRCRAPDRPRARGCPACRRSPPDRARRGRGRAPSCARAASPTHATTRPSGRGGRRDRSAKPPDVRDSPIGSPRRHCQRHVTATALHLQGDLPVSGCSLRYPAISLLGRTERAPRLRSRRSLLQGPG